MRKRLFTGVFVVLMMMVAMFCAASAEDWQYDVTAEGLVITAYTGVDEIVNIPDQLDGYKVTVIGKRAFADNTTIRQLSIPEGISAIKAEAFFGCSALSLIEFNARNCTVPEIWVYDSDKGAGVFSGAGAASPDGLKVVFGNKVSKIPDNLFETASYDVSGIDGYAYAYVTEVEISDSVREIGENAFSNCQELQRVTFGRRVQSIGSRAFNYCISLETVSFPDELSVIGKSTFWGCRSLESITWGSGLNTIGEEAFTGCNGLKKLSMVAPLTTIGIKAFAGCIGLREITIPESVTNIQAEAFIGCSALSRIEFNAKNCTVPDIWVHSSNKGVGVFSGVGAASPDGLKVVFGDKVAKVPDGLFDTASRDSDEGGGVSGYAFAYVTEVEISDSVRQIGANAFYNCQELENVTFGKMLQSIDTAAFYGCVLLTEVSFPDELNTIGDYAFSHCAWLEEITWGTGVDSIGDGAFLECNSLRRVEMAAPLTNIGKQAFMNCIGLREIVIPETVRQIRTEAFRGCSALSRIEFNAKDCAVPEIWVHSSDKGVGVFSGAGSASVDGMKVIFGEKVVNIPRGLFDTASQDESRGGGVSGYPFAYLREVDIPKNVERIEEKAFYNCQILADVVIRNGDAEIEDDAFTGCTDQEFVLYSVPGSSVEEYANAHDLRFEEISELEEAETI